MHHHPSWRWIVVSGTAKVIIENNINMLHENMSTFIPAGLRHQLVNLGKILLRQVTVQYETYLGEDEIVRFENSCNGVLF
jgi:mannose-6-phosphate isomerase-like protein (cupin superfamily)